LSAELDLYANSLERVQEYTEIEQENADGIIPPPKWPLGSGRIEVEGLTVRYGDEHAPALKNITFTVDPKMKVAVVGRFVRPSLRGYA
jgi:ABC-type multidrug transport system fused ATPase/permease subunit